MASIRLIKRRIKSAKNISQITKAMELVAASRMKKAQREALSGRLYAQKIYQMVMRLSKKVDYEDHPLLKRPESVSGWKLVVFVSTNKGLCGSLNTNLVRFTLRSLAQLSQNRYIVYGKKGIRFLRVHNGEILADFSDSQPWIATVPALTQLVTSEFTGGKCDSVDLVYSEFVSALKQVPRQKTILPLTISGLSADPDEADAELESLIEPDLPEVFNALLPHYLENQIRDCLLQAEASEQSARMVAMRNATDNAKSLVSELTLLYNKARQEKITYEISDMVTARLAVED